MKAQSRVFERRMETSRTALSMYEHDQKGRWAVLLYWIYRLLGIGVGCDSEIERPEELCWSCS